MHPVCALICDILPEGQRETTPSEIHFEDLERLPVDDVARISEWLTEKARPREEEQCCGDSWETCRAVCGCGHGRPAIANRCQTFPELEFCFGG